MRKPFNSSRLLSPQTLVRLLRRVHAAQWETCPTSTECGAERTYKKTSGVTFGVVFLSYFQISAC